MLKPLKEVSPNMLHNYDNWKYEVYIHPQSTFSHATKSEPTTCSIYLLL